MAQDEVQLSERKTQILLSAVEDYIQQASPITSSAVQNKCAKDLSTATLRNELNALEAMDISNSCILRVGVFRPVRATDFMLIR